MNPSLPSNHGSLPSRRIAVEFSPGQTESVSVRTGVSPKHPLLVFIVSPNPAEADLIARLFGRGGHCAVPIRNLSVANDVFWKVPPDMILLDDTLPVEEKLLFRSVVDSRVAARRIPVLEFSMATVRLNDRAIAVNGHVVGMRPGSKLAVDLNHGGTRRRLN